MYSSFLPPDAISSLWEINWIFQRISRDSFGPVFTPITSYMTMYQILISLFHTRPLLNTVKTAKEMEDTDDNLKEEEFLTRRVRIRDFYCDLHPVGFSIFTSSFFNCLQRRIVLLVE